MHVFHLLLLEKKFQVLVYTRFILVTLWLAILCLVSYSSHGKVLSGLTQGIDQSSPNKHALGAILVKNLVSICASASSGDSGTEDYSYYNFHSQLNNSGPGAPSIISVAKDGFALKIRFKTPPSGITLDTKYESSTDGGSTWQKVLAGVNYLTPANLSNSEAELFVFVGQNFPKTVQIRALHGELPGDSSLDYLFGKSPSDPTIQFASIANGVLMVNFMAPLNSGDGAILFYEFTTNLGMCWQVVPVDALPKNISENKAVILKIKEFNLSQGNNSTIQLRAVNKFGAGRNSNFVLIK